MHLSTSVLTLVAMPHSFGPVSHTWHWYLKAACPGSKIIVTHKMHPYGGGSRRLDLCADIFNEGIFILVVDDDLGPS